MTTATRIPVPRMKPEERRAQILQRAFELIAVGGFNSVALSDIAKACGIQKSSVLHHFPSMNDLLFAVLQMREEEDFLFYLDSPAEADLPEPAAARALFTRVFTHNLERQALTRLYSILSAEALDPEHPAHQYFSDRTRQARGEMAKMLSWKPNPVLAAVELHAFWDGMELAWRHDPNLDPLDVWESFCDHFFA